MPVDIQLPDAPPGNYPEPMWQVLAAIYKAIHKIADEAQSSDGGLTNGNKGAITVSGDGNTWALNPGVVGTSELGGDINAGGEALLTAADAAARRFLLGLGSAAVAAVESFVAADDARLTNTRVPNDFSVSDAKIADRAPSTFPITGPDGRPLNISAATLTTLLSEFTTTARGLVPLTGAGNLATRFMRADKAWVNPLMETGANTEMAMGVVANGAYLRRSGTLFVGDDAAVLGDFAFGSLPDPVANDKKTIFITGLGNRDLVPAFAAGGRWRPWNGRQLIYVDDPNVATSSATVNFEFAGTSVVVPATLLSLIGALEFEADCNFASLDAANNFRVLVNGTSRFSITSAAALNFFIKGKIWNNRSFASQWMRPIPSLSNGSSGTGLTATTIDTATTALTFQFQSSSNAGAPVARTFNRFELWWVD